MSNSVLLARGALAVWTLWLCGTSAVFAERTAKTRPSTRKAQSPPEEGSEGQPKASIAVQTLEAASSGREVKEAAIREIPTALLTGPHLETVERVLSSLSLFRRLPTIQCEVSPGPYQLFVEHPDLAVGMWRAMGISKLQLTDQGHGRYSLDTGDGTVGTLTVLARDDHHCLILCDGSFKSPLLIKPVVAEALFNLETRWVHDRAGTVSAIHRADLFVAFPSQTVETVAKVISPMSNRVLDKNFEEVSVFARMMQVAMAHQPGWIEQTSGKLDNVPADQVESLLRITAKIYAQQRRLAEAQGGE